MSERTRAAVTEYHRRLSQGDHDGVTELFADQVDWNIPGATDLVPWIGRHSTREGVRRFLDELTKGIIPDRFDIDRILVDGAHAVSVGRLRSTVRSTGKVIESPFTIQFEVNDDGLITKYLLLEDSWHIAQAVLP